MQQAASRCNRYGMVILESAGAFDSAMMFVIMVVTEMMMIVVVVVVTIMITSLLPFPVSCYRCRRHDQQLLP